jgi:hypothetical protein
MIILEHVGLIVVNTVLLFPEPMYGSGSLNRLTNEVLYMQIHAARVLPADAMQADATAKYPVL